MIRIVTQMATPNSQALNKVFKDFKNTQVLSVDRKRKTKTPHLIVGEG